MVVHGSKTFRPIAAPSERGSTLHLLYYTGMKYCVPHWGPTVTWPTLWKFQPVHSLCLYVLPDSANFLGYKFIPTCGLDIHARNRQLCCQQSKSQWNIALQTSHNIANLSLTIPRHYTPCSVMCVCACVYVHVCVCAHVRTADIWNLWYMPSNHKHLQSDWFHKWQSPLAQSSFPPTHPRGKLIIQSNATAGHHSHGSDVGE